MQTMILKYQEGRKKLETSDKENKEEIEETEIEVEKELSPEEEYDNETIHKDASTEDVWEIDF